MQVTIDFSSGVNLRYTANNIDTMFDNIFQQDSSIHGHMFLLDHSITSLIRPSDQFNAKYNNGLPTALITVEYRQEKIVCVDV